MSFPGASGYSAQPFGTEMTFSMTLDGTDELLFTNGSLVIRHMAWSFPTDFTINGTPVPLNFTNNLSAPVALPMPEGFQFTQLSGRTTLYPVRTPVGLVVGASDELLGADVYSFRIAAVPEPSLVTSTVAGGLGFFIVFRRHGSRKARR